MYAKTDRKISRLTSLISKRNNFNRAVIESRNKCAYVIILAFKSKLWNQKILKKGSV